jgi:hypothetical protein
MGITNFTLPRHVEHELSMTVESVPDHRASLVVTGALVAAFTVVGLCGLSIVIAPFVGLISAGDSWLVLLGLMLLGLGFAAPVALLRRWQRAPMPWMRVTPEGLESAFMDGVPGLLRWRDVGCDDAASSVVVTKTFGDSSLRHLKVPLRQGGHVTISLGYPNALKCVRFKNAWALRRAIVLQLAMIDQPRLRFDPDVFVGTRLDPRTWQAMHKPAWLLGLLMTGTLAVVVYVLYRTFQLFESPWWSIAAAFGVMLAGAMVVSWGQWVHFPDLRDVIAFECSTQARAAAAISRACTEELAPAAASRRERRRRASKRARAEREACRRPTSSTP